MKTWQKIDIWGRIFVLCAAAAQVFLVAPLSNFDFTVFWYDSIHNQINLMELIANPEMDYDTKTRLMRDFYQSENTNNQYGRIHKFLQKFGTWSFATLFLIGSVMLIIARQMEFERENLVDSENPDNHTSTSE